MAIGHIAVRTHNRGKGHCAAAALAYRHGTRLVNSLTGEAFCFRSRARRDEVVATRVYAPDRWQRGRNLQVLANLIEGAENRRNSQILRDVQVAVPHELEESDQLALIADFAAALGDRYHTVVPWAVHRPSGEDSDERNVHAHICLPTRRISEDGAGFGAKLRQLATRTQSSNEIAWMRNAWQEAANGYLEAAGSDARVHVGRRLDTEPEPTLPLHAPRDVRRKARMKHKRQLRESHAKGPIYAARAVAWAVVRRTIAALRTWIAGARLGGGKRALVVSLLPKGRSPAIAAANLQDAPKASGIQQVDGETNGTLEPTPTVQPAQRRKPRRRKRQQPDPYADGWRDAHADIHRFLQSLEDEEGERIRDEFGRWRGDPDKRSGAAYTDGQRDANGRFNRFLRSLPEAIELRLREQSLSWTDSRPRARRDPPAPTPGVKEPKL